LQLPIDSKLNPSLRANPNIHVLIRGAPSFNHTKMTDAAVVYPGKDLEAMSFAVKYHRWLLSEFSQFIGKHVVEVGAGTGSFSEMLLEMDPDSLSLVEPSEMFEQLEKHVAANGNKTVIDLYN